MSVLHKHIYRFDLELGQAIEKIYPVDQVGLSETDKTNICYLAFPDSNSGVMGDSQFHFRVRLSNDIKPVGHLSLNNCWLNEYNRRSPSAAALDPKYLFGFVYFRQVN